MTVFDNGMSSHGFVSIRGIQMKTEILDNLAQIEAAGHVSILHAVESGSRAWGVESPDSDYDVRFIYVRPMKDYLCIREKGDVIEWPLDEVFDINGWDLKKTLVQFQRGNAALFEWANSPVVYKTTDLWEKIYDACRSYFSEKAALYHYYGTAKSTFRQYLQEEFVPYKKYIYALRPLLACRYIETCHCVPPVRFDELLRQNLPDELTVQINEMLQVKARSDEKDRNPGLPVLRKYIAKEIDRYEQMLKKMPEDRVLDWERLDQIFLASLQSGPHL